MEILDNYKLTDFQKRVLIEVSKIPKGKVLTYAQVAKRIGRPKAYRAVGSALRKNPLPILIPCHRVVRSNGIGEYSFGGKRAKAFLLKLEGLQNFNAKLKRFLQ
ncbi:MAG: methylated-DNA--[protein]-cysteine S-methyltransferase [Candidatus Micrarchaeia archaeon]